MGVADPSLPNMKIAKALNTPAMGYLAGMMDGDGCFFTTVKHYSFGMRVEVTDRCIVEYLHATFGGRTCKRHRKGRKEIHSWYLTKKHDLQMILPCLARLLVIKQGQAAAMHELVRHHQGRTFVKADLPAWQQRSIDLRLAVQTARPVFGCGPGATSLLGKGIPSKPLHNLPNNSPAVLMRPPSQTQLAYLAGIIDSEGCISATHNDRFKLVISVADGILVDWLYEYFVGCVTRRGLTSSGNMMYVWNLERYGDLAYLLPLLLPHLTCKKAQVGKSWKIYSASKSSAIISSL